MGEHICCKTVPWSTLKHYLCLQGLTRTRPLQVNHGIQEEPARNLLFGDLLCGFRVNLQSNHAVFNVCRFPVVARRRQSGLHVLYHVACSHPTSKTSDTTSHMLRRGRCNMCPTRCFKHSLTCLLIEQLFLFSMMRQ